MPWNMIQIESFNMRERSCLEKPWNWLHRRTRPRADNNLFSAQDACAARRERHLNCFWPDKAPESHEQLCPARLEIRKVHVHQAVHHLPLAVTHSRHVDPGVVLGHTEFLTPPKVGGDLRAVDDVFARQTGDIRTGTSDILSLDDNSSHSFFS